MKIHFHYFRCVHTLLCVLLCLNLFTSLQDVTAFKSKKILYGLAIAHVLGLLKTDGHHGGGHNVVAHPVPMPMYPMPRKKCKKDVHYHEHINMHSYEDGYDLGGDDHYGGGGGDDDDLHLGSSYGKGHGGAYLDDDELADAGSYKLGKSSKYMMDDEADQGETGGEVNYDDEAGDELADDEEASPPDSSRISTLSSRKLSPSKLLATSSGSLKKYFKTWKRKRPKTIPQPTVDSYEEADELQDSKYEQLQDSESGESAETYYPSTTSQPVNASPTSIRHSSINAMTKASRKSIKSTRKSASLRPFGTPLPSELDESDSEPANSGELNVSSAATASSKHEPAVEDMRVKISQKKKKLKTYLQKIKIGQYFKPYMLNIGKASEGEGKTSGSKKEPSTRKLKKKYKQLIETSSAEANGGTQMQSDEQPQSQHVPMSQGQINGFYNGMGSPILPQPATDPSGHHQMMQQVMLMPASPMAPHPGGAITIMEQPGPYGYQVHQPPNAPHHQTMFVDTQTGQFLPGNPNMNHEIVAEQIVVQEPINAPSGHATAK